MQNEPPGLRIPRTNGYTMNLQGSGSNAKTGTQKKPTGISISLKNPHKKKNSGARNPAKIDTHKTYR